MLRPGRNDPCYCNSGKKYKKCHQPLEEGRTARTASIVSARTLRDKNIALIDATSEIFGLRRPWAKVKESFSDAQISEFYSFVASLWPLDTDLSALMPTPDSALRGLYLGENEPEAMLGNVFRFCLYADEIVVVYPFANPRVMAEKFNPILHPAEWRLQTLRLVFHLNLMAPWVKSGLVVMLPDPGDFDRPLRIKTWDLAADRLKGWEPSAADIDDSAMRQRSLKSFFMAPPDYLEHMLKETNPGISDEDVRKVLDYVNYERKRDPLLLNETFDNIPGQMLGINLGGNLEMGMYICQATGAFPYTNVRFRWKEILNAHQELDPTSRVWTPLTNAFQQLKFKFLDNVDSKFAYSIREDGRLEAFRSYLRKLWNTIGGEPDPAKSDVLARDFRDGLMDAFNQAKADWDAIDRDLLKWSGIGAGVAAVGTAIATGRMTLDVSAAGLAIGGISEIVQSRMKRREFRKKVPMSVFIDLDNR